jgi:hypothetical protein
MAFASKAATGPFLRASLLLSIDFEEDAQLGGLPECEEGTPFGDADDERAQEGDGNRRDPTSLLW